MSISNYHTGSSSHSRTKRIFKVNEIRFKFPELEEYYVDVQVLKMESRGDIERTNSFIDFIDRDNRDEVNIKTKDPINSGNHLQFPVK